MGMYDEVAVPCPTCHTTIYFQSKAGPCTLQVYLHSEAPPEIVADLKHETEVCSHCRKAVSFTAEQQRRPVMGFTYTAPQSRPSVSAEQLLKTIRQVREILQPTIWYGTSDALTPGKVLSCEGQGELGPPFIVAHPDDLPVLQARMPTYRFRHLREWRPTTPPTIREIQTAADERVIWVEKDLNT